jgi:hypothetical protein
MYEKCNRPRLDEAHLQSAESFFWVALTVMVVVAAPGSLAQRVLSQGLI